MAIPGFPELPQLPQLPQLPELPELPGANLPDFPVIPEFPWEDIIPPNQIIPDINWDDLLPDFPLIPGFFDTTSVSTDGNTYNVPTFTRSLTNNFLQNGNQLVQSFDPSSNPNALEQQVSMTIDASSWEQTVAVSRVARASANGDLLQGKHDAYDNGTDQRSGSILEGSDQSDTLRGLTGWDVLDGRGGDDLIRAGNGRDILSGGTGNDELHGDFGWNTYTSQVDGGTDLIAIKSDQFLSNWLYESAGNNPNGEKADIIEGLDAFDQIKIIGVASDQISFAQASAHGLDGIGIYAGGALEALYTGGNLSMEQLQNITSGDNSEAAMNNQIWSYNFGAEIPPVI